MSRNLKAITMYEWANEMNCAVTVCDTEGVILYMNEKACRTFAKHGNLIGKNLFDCHNPQSQDKIRELLETGGVNAYTIEKNGIRKMIYQTAWKQDGVVGSGRDFDGDTRRDAPLCEEMNSKMER